MQLGLAINLIHLLNYCMSLISQAKAPQDLSGAIGLGSRETFAQRIG